MHLNNVGLSFTAADQNSVDQFDMAVSAYLAAETNPMNLLDTLLDKDPEMIMAECLRGYLLKLAAHPRFAKALDACLANIQSLVELKRCTPREYLHVEALKNWVAGQDQLSLTNLENLLLDHPLDMLALRIAHYLHFYNGIGTLTRDSIQRILPAWNQATPNYGFLMGMYAFGLEESAEYKSAEDYGRQAIELNPYDIWASHAVTHVLEMQSRHEEGLAWMDNLRDNWVNLNNFRHHLTWHEALHHIGLGNPEAALLIYDAKLTNCLEDDFYLDICNAAALLGRLEFLGFDLGERWMTLARYAAPHTNDQELLFASLHYLIPLAQTQASEAGMLMESLTAWSNTDSNQGDICTVPGLQLAQSIMDAKTQPVEAARQLNKIKGDIYRIGGSAAQRDIFRLLCANSARRAEADNLMQNWPSPYNTASQARQAH